VLDSHPGIAQFVSGYVRFVSGHDSYQGMPSGMPQIAQDEALQALGRDDPACPL
jgi:hypothetical protein